MQFKNHEQYLQEVQNVISIWSNQGDIPWKCTYPLTNLSKNVQRMSDFRLIAVVCFLSCKDLHTSILCNWVCWLICWLTCWSSIFNCSLSGARLSRKGKTKQKKNLYFSFQTLFKVNMFISKTIETTSNSRQKQQAHRSLKCPWEEVVCWGGYDGPLHVPWLPYEYSAVSKAVKWKQWEFFQEKVKFF